MPITCGVDAATAERIGVSRSLGEEIKVERQMRIDGRRMTMVLAPGKMAKK